MKLTACGRFIGTWQVGLVAAVLAMTLMVGGCADTKATGEKQLKPCQKEAVTAVKPRPKSGRVELGAHVLIDWSVPQVEVDAKVVLREGPVKLLACKAGTKEPESVLAVPVKAQQIRDAMIKMGLNSGSGSPDSGQRLIVEIQWDGDGEKKTSVAHEWLLDEASGEPLKARAWVFLGSKEVGGGITADREGTVACLSDFESALIGCDAATPFGGEAGINANTAAIPEIGTACTLVIRELDEAPLELTLTPELYFEWEGNLLSPTDLDALVRERVRYNASQKVILSAMDGVDRKVALVAARCIMGSGINREFLTYNLDNLPEEDMAVEPGVPAAQADVAEPAETDEPEPTDG